MEADHLKPEEFDKHIKNGTLRLAFVGMSNAGKSYRSKVLRRDADFLWFHVDGEIMQALGFEDMNQISEWIGYPSSMGYASREAKYLELENQITRQTGLKTDGKNLVFDTTGSVAHLHEETLDTLHENCLIVHLDVGEDALDDMMERFFEHPKPVAWAGYFSQKLHEPEDTAIRRCYPKLLKDRLGAYRKLAHLNINASDVRDKTADETLAVIRSHLNNV